MKLRYELTEDVVNYLLQAVNRVQISGLEQAKSLLKVVEILKNPLNADELEKKQLETLKEKYESTGDK